MALLTETTLRDLIHSTYRSSWIYSFASGNLGRRAANVLAKVLADNFLQRGPTFRCYLNSAQSVPASATADVDFDTESWDSDSGLTLTGTSHYTIPTGWSGIWLIGASVKFTGVTTGGEVTSVIQVDPLGGGAYAEQQVLGEHEVGNTTDEEQTICASTLLDLDATDKVKITAYSPDDNAWGIGNGTKKTAFWGYYVGRAV